MKEQNFKGGCLCGAIRYEVIGEPVIVAHCHCVDCQKASGAGHSTGAMYSLDKFSLTGKVSEYIVTSNNSTEVSRVFCPTCGSSLFGKNTGSPDYVTISLGTLDDASSFIPEVRIFTNNCMPWDNMDEAIESFGEQPEWSP